VVSDQKVNGVDKQPTEQQRQLAVKQAGGASFATQANLMLAFGVPLTDVINLLCEIACDLVSAIEPSQLRQNVVSEMTRNFPGIVDRHYQKRHTTQSGLIVPGR
jgi:hypothetical protein